MLSGTAGAHTQYVAYHMNWPSPGNDPWYAADATTGLATRSFYSDPNYPQYTSISSTPSFLLDGTGYTGGSAGITNALNTRSAVASHVWFSASAAMNATGDSIIVTLKTVADTAMTSGFMFRGMINEIREIWNPPAPNTQTVFDYPMCVMTQPPSGIAFTHSGNTSDTVTTRMAFLWRRTGAEPYTLDNCCFIGYVYRTSNKEVMQAVRQNVATVRYPVGGEVVYTGDPLAVRWDAGAFTGNVNIQINRDYPSGQWETVVTNTANTGTANWTIAGNNTTTARIRVVNATNAAESGMSLLNFTITAPTSISCNPNPVTAQIAGGASGTQTNVTISNSGTSPYIGTMTANLGTTGYSYSTINANWVDASAGVSGPTGDDAMGGPYTLPFTFPFNGSNYTSVYMCTNGFITFQAGVTASSYYSNTALPSSLSNMIAPFWDDLNVTTGTTRVLMDGANNRAIFAWNQVPLYSPATSTVTCEVILYSDGRIEFQYGTFTGTMSSATIGVQASSTRYLQILFNSAVTASSGYSLPMQYRNSWGTPSTMNFNIAAGNTQQFTITWDATTYHDTTLTGSFTIAGNGTITVPVTLAVGAVSANEPIVVPTSFAVSEAYPNPFNPSTTVSITVDKLSRVTASVFDIEGREVATLLNRTMSPGIYHTTIDGSHLATGIYFLKVDAGSNHAVRKIVLVK